MPARMSTLFFYQGQQLCATVGELTARSIIGVDARPIVERYNQDASAVTHLVVADQLGSVLAHHRQQPPDAFIYGAYGYCASSARQLSAFTGAYEDDVTRCYMLGQGYRAYSPVLRRFLSPDSWSPMGAGGFNGYSYCSADPINNTDASGHTTSHGRLSSKLFPNRPNKITLAAEDIPRVTIALGGGTPRLGDAATVTTRQHFRPGNGANPLRRTYAPVGNTANNPVAEPVIDNQLLNDFMASVASTPVLPRETVNTTEDMGGAQLTERVIQPLATTNHNPDRANGVPPTFNTTAVQGPSSRTTLNSEISSVRRS